MGDERFGRDQSLCDAAGFFAVVGPPPPGGGRERGKKEARAIAGLTMRLGAAGAADAMRKRPFAAPKLNQNLA